MDISKVCGARDNDSWFDNNIMWKVGNGLRFRFWDDRGLVENSLAKRYPRLYNNSVCKNGKISKMSVCENDK